MTSVKSLSIANIDIFDTSDIPGRVEKLLWVTDLHHPKYLRIQENIVKALNSQRFKIVEQSQIPLNNGLTQFKYQVITLPGPSSTFGSITLSIEVPLYDVIDAISEIIYNPVTLSISNEDLTGEEIRGLTSIIEALIKCILRVEFKQLILSYFNDMIVWSPVPTIYQRDQYLGELLYWSDLTLLKGKQLLSTDGLTEYAVQRYQENFHDIPEDGVEVYHGIYLTKIGLDFNIFAGQIDNLIGRMRRQGFEVFRSYSEIDRLLLLELALMWDAEVKEFESYIVIQSSIDFSLPTNVWYRQATEAILQNDLPNFMLHDWENNSRQSDDLNPSMLSHRILLTYMAVRAYSRLIDRYPYLNPFLTQVMVNQHLTVIAKFASYAEVVEYRRLLRAETLNQDYFSYQIFILEDFNNSVLYRYHFQQSNPELTSLIIPMDDFYHLIFNTSDPGQLKAPTNTELETSQEAIMKQFQESCPGQAPLMTFSKAGLVTTDFTEILELIPLDNQTRKFCLLASFINQLPVKFNPITRSPLTEYTINRAKYWKQGLMGYFSTVVTKGFRSSPPLYVPIPPVDNGIQRGYPIVNKIKLEEQSVELLVVNVALHEDDFLVTTAEDLTNHPGRIKHLFDLMASVPSEQVESELGEAVLQLWSCGWFLSLWSSILMKNTGKLSHYLTETHPILYQAADSVIDGQKALATLQVVGNTVCK